MLGLPEAVHACLFDLDGVLTDTASVHTKAWKVMFDAFLQQHAEQTGEPFVREHLAFDEVIAGDRRVTGTFEIEARKFRDGILSVSRDVTERKETEANLAEARAEIQQGRFAQRQIAEINDRIIASLVDATRALDSGDDRGVQRAIQQTLTEASKIITDLRALPQTR